MKTINELIDILTLDKIGDNEFQGDSEYIGSPIVFGGQVLAQAVHAAYQTVSKTRFLHSLHSYFLEPGNLEIPIRFRVEETRNGGSFSTRRVKAMQNEKTIFILAASFHVQEEGYEHQIEMPQNLKQPEDLLSWDDIVAKFGGFLPKSMKTFLSIERPIEFKPTEIPNPAVQKNLPPKENVWFRLKGNSGELEVALKHQILTYISDYNILNAAINPNASVANWGNLQTASLDHSMWFFRDFDVEDWLLFSAESPSSFGARGLSRGNIFTRNGILVASFAQEGLLRPISS